MEPGNDLSVVREVENKVVLKNAYCVLVVVNDKTTVVNSIRPETDSRGRLVNVFQSVGELRDYVEGINRVLAEYKKLDFRRTSGILD